MTRLQSEKGAFVQSPKFAFDSEETEPPSGYSVSLNSITETSVFECPGQFVQPVWLLRIGAGISTISKAEFVPTWPQDAQNRDLRINRVDLIVTPTAFELDTSSIVVTDLAEVPSCIPAVIPDYWVDVRERTTYDVANDQFFFNLYLAPSQLANWPTGVYTFTFDLVEFPP